MGKKSKKSYIETSEFISELTITSAFLGASKNFFIIEDHFFLIKNIPLNQYLNYLSQLAFCLELGLKNIIKITNKVWKSHDLEELFYEANKETNGIFCKKFFGSYNEKFKNEFLTLLGKIKYLFEEARYCYGSSLAYFFHDRFLVKDDIIGFNEILNQNEPLMMLKLLHNELGEYHNFVHKNSLIPINKNQDEDSQIQSIISEKFKIQESINIEEK